MTPERKAELRKLAKQAATVAYWNKVKGAMR
jgi:hypothetical protein